MEGKQDIAGITGGLSEADFIRTLRMLAASALNDGDALTRKHAIYLIGNVRNPDCIPVLVQALKDQEKEVRKQATLALALIGNPASPNLIGLLQDPDWKIRYRAAEALGMIGETTAIPFLIGILSDRKDHVRYMAVKSLGMIGNPEVRGYLLVSLNDENPYVRSIAASVLSEIGH